MDKNKFFLETNKMNSRLTCVSGYWMVKNKHKSLFYKYSDGYGSIVNKLF